MISRSSALRLGEEHLGALARRRRGRRARPSGGHRGTPAANGRLWRLTRPQQRVERGCGAAPRNGASGPELPRRGPWHELPPAGAAAVSWQGSSPHRRVAGGPAGNPAVFRLASTLPGGSSPFSHSSQAVSSLARSGGGCSKAIRASLRGRRRRWHVDIHPEISVSFGKCRMISSDAGVGRARLRARGRDQRRGAAGG